MAYTVILTGGSPWGFRMEGGSDFGEPLRIAKLNRSSKAYNEGIQVGDHVEEINSKPTSGMMNSEALQLIRSANDRLVLELRRGGTIPKKTGSNSLTDVRLNGQPATNGDVNHNIVNTTAPQPGLLKSNALLNHCISNDDDVSGSTSDSQSSIIHVPAPSTQQPVDMDTAIKPSNAVWSPYGSAQTKTYKPVSFSNVTSNRSQQEAAPFATSLPGDSAGGRPPSRQNSVSSATITLNCSSPSPDSGGGARPFSPGPSPGALFSATSNASAPGAGSSGSPLFNRPVSPLPKPGVWSAGQQTPSLMASEQEERERQRQRDIEQQMALRDAPAKWTPGGSASTLPKEFRSVKLDAPVKSAPKERPSSPSPQESFAWKPPESSTSRSPATTPSALTSSSPARTNCSNWNGAISHFAETKSGMPNPTSPTITLLQKNRDGDTKIEVPANIKTVKVDESDIPSSALFVGSMDTVEGDSQHTDSYYLLPAQPAGQKVTVVEGSKAPNYSGIGPMDNQTGMPIGLRSHVDETKQKDWYKKMYSSLHRLDKPKDEPISTQTADSSETTNTYRPTYTFPEDKRPSSSSGNKEDGSTMSLDRFGRTNISPTREPKTVWSPPHAKYRSNVYKNQPRSIVDYEPGRSSLAEKEAKVEEADERPKSPIYNPPIEKPGQYSKYTESDSEFEVRSRERRPSTQSEISSRQLYRQVQKGADIPYSGLGYPLKESRNAEDKPHASPPPRHAASGGTSSAKITLRTNGHGRSLSASEQLGVTPAVPQRTGVSKGRTVSQSTLPSSSSPLSPGRYRPADRSSSTLDRRRQDEEEAQRKERMQRMYAEEKRKRMEQEKRKNESRRHSDFYISSDENYWLKLAGVDGDQRHSQKSPIPDNRFDDGQDAPSLARPTKKVHTKLRGKAKALYTFRAQNPRELSFRRGDTIFLLRQIDKNWYEGEHHGRTGIFPMNYVEVLTSLEEARVVASEREGQARARYNFTAHTPLELTIKNGDMVTLIRQVDENWFEGRLDGQQGIFPVSYVDIINEPQTPMMTPMMTPRSSYACTPLTCSPGQLSPVSTASYGPAPTIPSAPTSPRGFDMNDLQQRFANQTSLVPPGRYGLPPRADSVGSPSPLSPAARGFNGFSSMADGNAQSGKQTSRASTSSRDSQARRYKEPIYPPFRSIYNYRPQNEDELELLEGDTVYVMEKCDDGWYVGTSGRTKEFGTFPGNYVRPL